MMQKRGMGLLLAGLAAYGYYKYSKMSAEEKRNLMDKGKKIVEDNFGSLGNLFGKKATPTTNGYNQP